jgi:ketosteroid isomerase-like protein
MTDAEAVEFGQRWADAWNRRDLEAVLAHVHERCLFTFPVAQSTGFAADGVVRGKADIRRYWTLALAGNLDLKFTITTIYRGSDTLIIGYRNQHSVERAEVLVFEAGRVVRGHGTFAART